MAFDQAIRNRLARFVTDTRSLLTEEFTRQLQNEYGLDPASGEVTSIENLTHLDDTHRETASLLRETLTHYLASSDCSTPAKTKKSRKEVLDRIVREQAFTVLNRLCALRMAEARGILIESLARGFQSKGFQLYQRIAGNAIGETGETYQQFLFSIFDEFALDLSALFDRFSQQGRLFPKETVLLQVLNEINHPDIAPLWSEDETIGWIYQYFNSIEERRQMRTESQAPRNSRELAVRNQFFTPRYVVEFLTDNTLGRLWYEMMNGKTKLAETCRYLICRPNEVFLEPGKEVPQNEDNNGESETQEQLLNQVAYIPYRAIKDPRDIKMLDPACGSMHFGLYAFDLFETIYDEAWGVEEDKGLDVFSRSESLHPLHQDYPDRETFLRDVPRLIIEHNIHGVDIDPRAAQIAGLSLWLRAQRSWLEQGVRAANRPKIRKSNVVCAEPMPGEADMLEEFTSSLQPRLLGQLLKIIFEKMKLAGEAGTLLKIEEEIKEAIADANTEYRNYILEQNAEENHLPGLAPEREPSLFDFDDITHPDSFWETAESRLIFAIKDYAEQFSENNEQRRLFATDAARGFAFIDICRKRYDVVVMNPPFGLATTQAFEYLREKSPDSYTELYACFVERARSLIDNGFVGAITSRGFYSMTRLTDWRVHTFIPYVSMVADIGLDVMDSAFVRSAAYVLSLRGYHKTLIVRTLSDNADRAKLLLANEWNKSSNNAKTYIRYRSHFKKLPAQKFIFKAGSELSQLFSSSKPFEGVGGFVRTGLTSFDDFRFVRLLWEVPPSNIGRGMTWEPFSKGGDYAKYYTDIYLCINREMNGKELAAVNQGVNGQTAQSCQGSTYYYKPGLTFTSRSNKGLSVRALPAGCIISHNAPTVYPAKGVSNSYLLGWINSRIIRLLVELQASADYFTPGSVKNIPWTFPSEQEEKIVSEETNHLVNLYQFPYLIDETSPLFNGFSFNDGIQHDWEAFQENIQNYSCLIAEKQKYISGVIDKSLALDSSALLNDINVNDSDNDVPIKNYSKEEWFDRSISFLVGISLHRWTTNAIKSANRNPFDTFIATPTILNQKNCDLISQTILVDDPGHKNDITTIVFSNLHNLSETKCELIENDIDRFIKGGDLRSYINDVNMFFAFHLALYSKTRRCAPVYWPLSTSSGSYTLWLYYHQLTNQTLYSCVNDFVDPKLKHVIEEEEHLRNKISRSSQDEHELERLLGFEQELKDFRDELLRVAQFWKPNLNDGVEITAAPLWKLFRHRQWSSRLKATWEKLESGEYDWAHLALSIWPDRVVHACIKDHSYAIAHDLEKQLWHEVKIKKTGRGGRVTESIEWRPRELSEMEIQAIVAKIKKQ